MFAQGYEAVLEGKYPAKTHAKRVVELLRDKLPDPTGVLYLEGGITKLLEDSDELEPFRQRRHFFYLTGCNLPDCFFIYDLQDSKSTLFIPPVNPEEIMWSGPPMSITEALKTYDVDEVKYSTELDAVFSSYVSAKPNSTIFTITSALSPLIRINTERLNSSLLKLSIEQARVIKDEYEIAMIRKANRISSLAHTAVLQKARAAENECELEAVFLERCVAQNAKKMAYPPIFASGKSAAVLHYEANDASTCGKLNMLVDAGAEWGNYASDTTRTFPLSGRFSKESRDIYEIVYKMQMECIAMIKEGVNWDGVHLLAHEIATDGLLELGILKGTREEVLENQISLAFFPHGLGHYLGLETHDTGGNPDPNDQNKLFRHLRTRGVLPAGSVITVEPGIYFCEHIIASFLEDPKHRRFIDTAVLDRYYEVGGVRLEDNVLVTVNGCINLTTVVKGLADVEVAVRGEKLNIVRAASPELLPRHFHEAQEKKYLSKSP